MTGLDLSSALVLAALIVAGCVGMWTLIPRWHGVTPARARPKWIRRALRQVGVQPGEVVYDLGSGDGRVLAIAAREFGARAVGYEIEPLHCVVSWFRALFSGVLGRVTIRCRDLYAADLARADVVFLYLNPVFVEKLRPYLIVHLRPGARVVSLDFPFDGWAPSAVDIGYLLFSYEMPPAEGSIEEYLRHHLTPLDTLPGTGDEDSSPVAKPD